MNKIAALCARGVPKRGRDGGRTGRRRVLLIDNYDSFTYNLVHVLGELGAEVEVLPQRRDRPRTRRRRCSPTHLVISPGPGRPDEAGVSCALIRRFAGRDADARRVPRPPVHGRGASAARSAAPASSCTARPRAVRHDRRRRCSAGLPDGFEAARYHSLAASRAAARGARA